VFDTGAEIAKKVDKVPTPTTTSRSTGGNRFAVLLMEEDEPISTTNDFPSLTRGGSSLPTAPMRIRDTKKSVWKKPPTISVAPPKTKKVKKTVTFQGPPLPTQAHTVPLEEQLAQMRATLQHQRDQIGRLQKEKEILFMDAYCPIRPLSSFKGDRKRNMKSILSFQGLEPVDTPANVCMSWGDGCGGGECGEDGAELDWGDLCVD
jgi:hypothetical protein